MSTKICIFSELKTACHMVSACEKTCRQQTLRFTTMGYPMRKVNGNDKHFQRFVVMAVI